MWIANDGEIAQVTQCLIAPLRRYLLTGAVTPQNLGDFEIKEVRGMEGFSRCKEAIFNGLGSRGNQKHFKNRRGIYYDHYRSRSALMASAGGTLGFTGVRS